MAIIGIGSFIEVFDTTGGANELLFGKTSDSTPVAVAALSATNFAELVVNAGITGSTPAAGSGVTIPTGGGGDLHQTWTVTITGTLTGKFTVYTGNIEALPSSSTTGARSSANSLLLGQVDGNSYYLGRNGQKLLLGSSKAATAGTVSVGITEAKSGFVRIAEVNGFQGPGFTKEEVDITTLDSVGGFRRFITTLKDAGQATMEMNFTRDSYKLMSRLYKLAGTPGVRNWALTLNDNPTGLQNHNRFCLWFQASVLSLPMNIPLADKITQTSTLRLTGEPLDGLVSNVYSGLGPQRKQGSDASDPLYVAADTAGTALNDEGTFDATVNNGY